jgi:segregation and condensation protein A
VLLSNGAPAGIPSLQPVHLSVPGFDGSLELLLHLLGQGEMKITAVSLAGVSDQYLASLRLIPDGALKLGFLAEFLIVAAQLLVLKSRALLPRETAPIELEEMLDEASLAERLQEYRRYRAAASRLHERQARGERAFIRTAPPPLPIAGPPPRLESAAPEQLARALQRLLATRAPKETPEQPPRLTIGDRIDQIRAALHDNERVAFLALAATCETRGDLICTFLAILELYRASEIEIAQDSLFGDIWLARVPAVTTVTPTVTPTGHVHEL